MDKNTLHKLAIAYLQENKGSWPDIADETGLGYQWLCKLAQGHFTDPGVNKVEHLLRHAGLIQVSEISSPPEDKDAAA